MPKSPHKPIMCGDFLHHTEAVTGKLYKNMETRLIIQCRMFIIKRRLGEICICKQYQTAERNVPEQRDDLQKQETGCGKRYDRTDTNLP